MRGVSPYLLMLFLFYDEIITFVTAQDKDIIFSERHYVEYSLKEQIKFNRVFYSYDKISINKA